MFRFNDYSKEEILKAVKQNGYSLQYVKEQTEAVCLEAVKQNGRSLQYVKEQSEAVCLEAVKQDGDSLQYVEIKSEDVLKIASAYKKEYEIFVKEGFDPRQS